MARRLLVTNLLSVMNSEEQKEQASTTVIYVGLLCTVCVSECLLSVRTVRTVARTVRTIRKRDVLRVSQAHACRVISQEGTSVPHKIKEMSSRVRTVVITIHG